MIKARSAKALSGVAVGVTVAVLPLSAWTQQQAALSMARATALITPFYGALTASSPEATVRLLSEATSADWQNCAANDACQSRDDVIKRWTGRIAVVPDMRWQQKEVLVSGTQIIVRGEDTGTPVAPFMGVAPNGRSFRIMTLDIHEVRDNKIVRTHHVEDWASAVRQLSAS